MAQRDDRERDRLLTEGAETYRRYISAEVVHGYATASAIGINATDFFCLNLVALAGSMSAGELARRTGLTTGATTRLIDRLEDAGLVRRVRAADRRQVIVELTGDRLPEIDKAIEPARRRLLEVFQSFDAEQIRTIFTYFATATTALVAAVEELTTRPDA